MNRILTAAGAGVATLLLAGQAFAGPSEPVVLIDQANPADSTISAINEDEPGWNCLTMGNRECGPDFQPYPSPVQGADFQWHMNCLIYVGDTSYLVCPDGFTTTS